MSLQKISNLSYTKTNSTKRCFFKIIYPSNKSKDITNRLSLKQIKISVRKKNKYLQKTKKKNF